MIYKQKNRRFFHTKPKKLARAQNVDAFLPSEASLSPPPGDNSSNIAKQQQRLQIKNQQGNTLHNHDNIKQNNSQTKTMRIHHNHHSHRRINELPKSNKKHTKTKQAQKSKLNINTKSNNNSKSPRSFISAHKFANRHSPRTLTLTPKQNNKNYNFITKTSPNQIHKYNDQYQYQQILAKKNKEIQQNQSDNSSNANQVSFFKKIKKLDNDNSNLINKRIVKQQIYYHHLYPLSTNFISLKQEIEKRYKKSKIQNYEFQQQDTKNNSDKSEESIDMQEYKHLKNIRIVNLKEVHKFQSWNILNTPSKRNLHSKSQLEKYAKYGAIDYDGKLIIKEINYQSKSNNGKNINKLNYLKPYLNKNDESQRQFSNGKSELYELNKDWKYISMLNSEQKYQKSVKNKSYRALTLESQPLNSRTPRNIQDGRRKLVSPESKLYVIPKLKDFKNLQQKFKF